MAKHIEKIQLNDRGGVESDEDKDVSAQNRGLGTLLAKGASTIGSNIAGAFSNWGGYTATGYEHVTGGQDKPETQVLQMYSTGVCQQEYNIQCMDSQ